MSCYEKCIECDHYKIHMDLTFNLVQEYCEEHEDLKEPCKEFTKSKINNKELFERVNSKIAANAIKNINKEIS